MSNPVGLGRSISLQNLFSQSGWNNAPLGRKQLHPVVRRRIMTSGNLDATGRPASHNLHSHGRRCHDAAVDGVAPHGLQTRLNGLREHFPRRSAVASDKNIARRRNSGKSRGIADGHLLGKRLAHDSPQSRNTYNRFRHEIVSFMILFVAPIVKTVFMNRIYMIISWIRFFL